MVVELTIIRQQKSFASVADTQQRIPENLVPVEITHQEWQNYWKGALEETSSSKSDLHFGHYKAGASSEIISHLHVTKTSIALSREFGLEWWSQGLSVMLKKVRGRSLIGKLHSILLMEADFN